MATKKAKPKHGTRTRGTLNDRQAAFVREYLIDLNGTQAAIRAGYSKRSASGIAIRLLRKNHVQAAIQAAMDARAKRLELSADNVLEEIRRVAFCDPRQFFRADGSLVPIPELSAEAAAALAGMDVEEVGGGDRPLIRTKKIRLVSKVAALEMAAKHLRLLVDRAETRQVDKDGNDAPLPAVIVVPQGYASVEDYDADVGGSSADGG